MNVPDLKKEMLALADPEKASFFPKFFKTGKGEYGEGDKFIGITVPNMRKLAKKYKSLPLNEVEKLLFSEIHEHRLISLFILVAQFEKGDEKARKEIYDFYYKNRAQVNNWDLVDSSAHKIVGPYLEDKDRKVLYRLAKAKSLWDRRIAMLSTFHYIRKGESKDCMAIAEMLVGDTEDLMHKAVGWMLREMAKRDMAVVEKFLDRHHKTMPRTMLRYAIERFPEERRKHYMAK